MVGWLLRKKNPAPLRVAGPTIRGQVMVIEAIYPYATLRFPPRSIPSPVCPEIPFSPDRSNMIPEGQAQGKAPTAPNFVGIFHISCRNRPTKPPIDAGRP